MAEKKGKLDLKGLKNLNLFGTKKSSLNMDNQNEEINDTENSHLDEVIFIKFYFPYK